MINQLEVLNKISFLQGAVLSQISFLRNDSLSLFVKREISDRSSFCKIIFSDVLGFHDTGIIGNKVGYVDVGVLGFKYISHARENDKQPEEYYQILFKKENSDNAIELIIACQGVEVIF